MEPTPAEQGSSVKDAAQPPAPAVPDIPEEAAQLSPALAITPPSSQKFSLYLVVGLLCLGVVVLAGSWFVSERVAQTPVKQFATTYTLVPEKISKSAPITITLPSGIDEPAAQAGITFSPAVEGEWQTEEIAHAVVFQPKQPLRSGVYYAVNLDTEAAQVSGDFYVDEDPEVTAMFPGVGTEAHEDSEITIIFNRPMVPLTTLSEQEKITLPITITPPTLGTFKWISTRNLQFIPETTLIPSSDYTVSVGEGMVSLDGLPIAPFTHSFVTRPLHYEYISNGEMSYRAPIVIQFNQPVDLASTKSQIEVKKSGDQSVAIDVVYGETTYYDYESGTYVTEADPSKLFIYQKADTHGRSRLWDFDTTYSVAIGSATPEAGTKRLEAGKRSVVTIPNIIRSTTATSDRTSLVRPDLFDPTGTLVVTFYDEIDKDRSSITAKGLRAITYGERCKTDEQGEPLSFGSGCEKVPDHKTLIFNFDANAFTPRESFAVLLQRIVTPDGFRLSEDELKVPVTVYPTVQIYRTVPANGAQAASSGDGIYICTNTPLLAPEEGYVDEYLHADGYVIYGRMERTRYITKKYTYDKCNSGEFETWFQAGLLPETFYSFDLKIKDVFSQTATGMLAFTTAPAEAKYTRFHNMQQQYNVTPPERTTLTYAAENLEYMDMHICRLEPEVFLERTVNQAERYTPPQAAGCTNVVTDTISLPKRYWVNNYFQVDLRKYFPDPRGHYIVTFSHPLYREQSYDETRIGRPLYDRTYVSVTNLAIGKKEIEHGEQSYGESTNPGNDDVLKDTIARSTNLYWVNTSSTLSPVSGAMVTQYQGGRKIPFVKASASVTDGQGVARTPVQTNLVGAVIRSGSDTAVITDWADTLRGAGQTRDASRTYVYTDRPIYRPGHTVHIRGIDRIGFDGSYEVWNQGDIPLQVFDARGARVYEGLVPANDYGTFSASFDLPPDATLGTYRIEVFGQSSQFDVEEYVPAAFKLEAETNQTEYTSGDTLKLAVQADYYFGVPVSGGTVSYSVTAQDYYFDRYRDEYFNFGQSWYDCYSCGYGDDFLFRGEVQINSNGRALIERPLDFKDLFNDQDSEGSKLINVSVTAKDINGRSVSLQKSFIVHKGQFYIGAKTDTYYTGVNRPVNLRVKTVDQTGQPIALSGIERTVYKVHWETFKRQEVDGGFYYRSEKKRTEVSRERIKTDARGDWSGIVTLTEAGQYEIQVTKADDRGNRILATSNLYIYGDQAIAMPPNNNYDLEVETERAALEVGDTGSILIKSPYQTAKVLITAERGTIYDYWIADVTGGLYLHEFPITSGYAPNVFISALLLSSDPEVKYGSVRFDIGTQEHALTVDVTANKTHYLPGEAVTLRVSTKDHTGQGVPAEVSLAVADLSVLALKGNPKKNPILFFYDGFPLSVSTASNIKNILHEVDVPLGTKGGGGASPDDLAKKKRGEFKDTAFWAAAVMTDTNGQASVTFTLPDNLTTWRVEGLGVTKDTKLGVDYDEFTTKKDLMAVPLKPRFVVPGDTFSLGATVFNQTDKGVRVAVTLASETLTFPDKSSDSVFINAGESKVVYFDVVAPSTKRAGSHSFTFTASADAFVDNVEQIIPITPNTTYETVATANFTKAAEVTEYLYVPDTVVSGEGGLTIHANATLAVFMTDALSYMVTYPYGCSEQLASSLSTIGTLTHALSLPNVEGTFDTITYDGVTYTVDEVVTTGLSQIYESQTQNGGFAYYQGLKPSLYLTMHVAEALSSLRDAGYEIRTGVLERAVAYIETEALAEYYRATASRDTVILAEYILRVVNGGAETALTKVVSGFVSDKAFLNEKMSSLTLAYLAIITAENFPRTVRDDVYSALKNRIDIDGRGAYLTTIPSARSGYFETTTKNTALLLKVFAAHNDEHPAMANVLRWLLASRDHRGVWGSTHNTFSVVDAMIDYLVWQEEATAHFSLSGWLADREIFGFAFNPTTVFTTFTHHVSIDELPKDTLLPLTLKKTELGDQANNLYYDLALKYFLPVASLPPRDEGITITRHLYTLDDARETKPITEATVGDVIKGKLTITIPDVYTHVAIEDIIPAGFEIVNFNLATEDQSLRTDTQSPDELYGQAESGSWFSRLGNFFGSSQTARVGQTRRFVGQYGSNEARMLRPTHTESHDDRVFLYVEQLSPGVYEYEYFLRALVPGEFQHLPARAEELFFPEVFGRTDGGVVTISSE